MDKFQPDTELMITLMAEFWYFYRVGVEPKTSGLAVRSYTLFFSFYIHISLEIGLSSVEYIDPKRKDSSLSSLIYMRNKIVGHL